MIKFSFQVLLINICVYNMSLLIINTLTHTNTEKKFEMIINFILKFVLRVFNTNKYNENKIEKIVESTYFLSLVCYNKNNTI